MSVTASIVVHNSPEEQLENALKLLLKADIKKVYVIDNSPEAGYEKIQKLSPEIIYRHVENRGFGSGHNIALKDVIRDFPDGFHLVMNCDVSWDNDNLLQSLTGYLKDNPGVGMVMPKVFYPDGSLQYTCRMLPSPGDLLLKRFLPRKLTKKRMERYLLEHHDHDKPLNCPYLLGSFLLFRNRALKECGLFDERFFMYPEDIDITRRIHRNWKTMYWPGVSIIHNHEAASRKNLKMLGIHLGNMMKYFNKWGWFSDKERKIFNKRLSDSISYLPESKRPKGKG